MIQIRRLFAYSVVVPIFGAVLACFSMPGCSGDSTVVAEGDPAVRRKNKDDALNKKLYPNGMPKSAKKGAKMPESYGP